MDIIIPAENDFVLDMIVGLDHGVARLYKTGPRLSMDCNKKLLFIEKFA
jgi:hypothetical protein